jgi:nickel transport protein
MKWKAVLLSVPLVLLGTAGAALAHGARVEYTIGTVVEIEATYDSGEPMAGGQVTVYAPDDLTAPWLTGICDDEGRFSFAPDPGKPGTYDVQVRQAGHGDIVHIPISEGAAISGGSSFTVPQIVLMAASVGWGFVGTALFFSRRRTTPPEESEA